MADFSNPDQLTMREEYRQTSFVTDQTLPKTFDINTAHTPFGGRATAAENENDEVRLVDCKGLEGGDAIGAWSALQAPVS